MRLPSYLSSGTAHAWNKVFVQHWNGQGFDRQLFAVDPRLGKPELVINLRENWSGSMPALNRTGDRLAINSAESILILRLPYGDVEREITALDLSRATGLQRQHVHGAIQMMAWDPSGEGLLVTTYAPTRIEAGSSQMPEDDTWYLNLKTLKARRIGPGGPLGFTRDGNILTFARRWAARPGYFEVRLHSSSGRFLRSLKGIEDVAWDGNRVIVGRRMDANPQDKFRLEYWTDDLRRKLGSEVSADFSGPGEGWFCALP